MSLVILTKGADESRSSNTVAADSELSFAVTTGRYRVRGFVEWKASGAAGIRMGLNVNGAAVVFALGYAHTQYTPGSSTEPEVNAFVPSNLAGNATRAMTGGSYPGTKSYFVFDVILEVYGSGTMELVWAQNATTPADPSIVLAGSTVLYQRTDAIPGFAFAQRTTDATRSAATDPTDDDVLAVTLKSGIAYAVEACLLVSGTTIPRIQVGVEDTPVSAHLHNTRNLMDSIGSFQTQNSDFDYFLSPECVLATAPIINMNGYGSISSSDRGVLHFSGVIVAGSGDTVFRVRLGQSGAGTVYLRAGSWICAEELPECQP